MGHDQLFKDILRSFFRDFLGLFYPEVEKRLDFDTLRFLDKEVFTSLPEGSSREVDVLAELETGKGSRELVLVHVEVEAKRKRGFPKRMFQYFALLWAKYQIPIFPIVVYLRGGQTAVSEEDFRMSVFGREQRWFRYSAVALTRFDGREYVEKGTPLAAGLAALMSRRKTPNPLALRAAMMRRVAESELDDARKFLLSNLIETYFGLSGENRRGFERLIAQERYREVRKMQLTWADKMLEKARKKGLREGRREGRQEGLQEGRQEGLQEGLLEGKRDDLLRILSTRFGPVPERTASQVRALDSIEALDRYLDRAVTAISLEEMGLGE